MKRNHHRYKFVKEKKKIMCANKEEANSNIHY